MALLNKLTNDGSRLTDLDGKNGTKYNGKSNYQKDLSTSQLDLNGKTPSKYSVGIVTPGLPLSKNAKKGLAVSNLDLDGKRPKFYDRKTNYQRDLAVSNLDLNGKKTSKYSNNLPK